MAGQRTHLLAVKTPSDVRAQGPSALRMVLSRVVIDVRCPLLAAWGLTHRSASTWLHENVGPIH